MNIAFLYPGQGSHVPGMADPWRDHAAGALLDRLGDQLGMPLADLADDPEACGSTAVVQPVLYAMSMVATKALVDAGVRPDAVAGHSLGEVAAATAAGSLSAAHGAELVAERGRAMGEACASSPGSMGAVMRLAPDDLAPLVARVPDVCIANDNAPGQVVVSGTEDGLDRLSTLVAEAGGRLRRLDVEGAFHSPAMAPACARVARTLRELDVTDPERPFVSGATGRELESADAVRRVLVDGILSPVRWRDTQRRLADLGADLLVEVGPGSVLRGLAKRTVPDVTVLGAGTPEDVEAVAEFVAASRRAGISAGPRSRATA